MRNGNEQTHEQDYWDDYLKEFGPSAYVQARYVEGAQDMEESAQGRADIVYSYVEPCPMCGVVHPT